MSLLIKGMEMPKSCFDCPFMYGRRYCRVNSKIEFNDPEYSEMKGRYDGCSLVPVPPHGDLIDRGYVKEHLYACEINGRPLHTLELCELLDAINDIPTIIQAEEDET